jgi:hypothetical protein
MGQVDHVWSAWGSSEGSYCHAVDAAKEKLSVQKLSKWLGDLDWMIVVNSSYDPQSASKRVGLKTRPTRL